MSHSTHISITQIYMLHLENCLELAHCVILANYIKSCFQTSINENKRWVCADSFVC